MLKYATGRGWSRPAVEGSNARTEVLTLRDPCRNILVSLTGVMATVVIGHVVFEWSSHYYVAYNPPLGLLFTSLYCVTFLGIGYFATRVPALQGGIAYLVGSMIVTTIDYAPAVNPGTHYFPLPVMLRIVVANSYSLQ